MNLAPAGVPSRSIEVPVLTVDAQAYRIPTDQPEGDGTLTWDATTLVLAEVRAGNETGIGWTYGPAATVGLIQELLGPVVRGADALAPKTVNETMVHAVRNAGRRGAVALAISAVDIALWDLCARLHGLPLGRLWGTGGSAVEVYGSGGFTTYDDHTLRSQLSRWMELGLRRVKIKVGESHGHEVSRDMARAVMAREAVGEGIELFVDANGGYSVGQARRIGKELDDLGVTWFEEPVSSDDLPGLGLVRHSVSADVTAGEYGFEPAYFARMADAGAVDCLQVDVTRCGGYTGWHDVSAVASAYHLDLSGHCAPYVSLPVAAATRTRHLEWFHDHVRIEQQLFDGCPDPVDSQLEAADAPGHGLAFRSRDAADLRIR